MSWSEALLILKLAGYSEEKAKEILKELGFKEKEEKELKPTPLTKALFYHEAYKLALKLKEENPTWGYRRISKEIEKKLRIKMPPTTVYYWILGKARPSIMPITINPELGYVLGTLLSDCYKKKEINFMIKDKEYAGYFVESLRKISGKEYEIKKLKGYYVVRLKGTPLRYITRNLWKIIAFIYPIQFLQGLYDGDGGISIGIKGQQKFRISISLTNSDPELLKFVKQLLIRFGINARLRLQEKRGKKVIILDKERVLKRDVWDLLIEKQDDVIKFYKLIGFRIQRRQRKLEDAIRILKEYKSNKERIKIWTKPYVKKNGRWIPKPSPTLFLKYPKIFIYFNKIYSYFNNK